MDNREKLIKLSSEGKIKYKRKFLTEADDEEIERIYNEYEAQQLDEANEQLSEILISKFSNFMEKFELVVSKDDLENDLSKNELLKKDIKTIVGYITPHIPFIGLISGGITVGGHVVSKKLSKEDDE